MIAGKRRFRVSNGVAKLSGKTNVIDCHGILRAYLDSIGKQSGTIGDTAVYVVRRSNRVVGAGASEAEALADMAKRGAAGGGEAA